MTTSVIVRIILIIITFIILVVYRLRRSDEAKQKSRKKKQERRKAERSEKIREARRQKLAQAEKQRERTSQTLKLGLEGLKQKVAEIGADKTWYLEGGAGEGRPTVLLLHGFAGVKEDWSRVGKYLVLQKCHVVAPDLPGFGQNERLEQAYDVTEQTKRIRTFARYLGVVKLHLVGCSLGGSIAAAYAYSAAEEVLSLTLIEPFGVDVPYDSELDQALARGLHPLTIANPAAYDNLLGFLCHKPPKLHESVKRIRAEDAARHRDFYLKMWPQIRGGERANLLDLLLPEIRARTLVIQGEQSRVVHPATAEILRRRMKDATAVTLPECGHFAMADRPEDVARHLLAFLGKPVGGAPSAGA